ncbi:MAG: hypothetical protein QM541_07685 [Flavobacterium sp.]|nr:hypothetical protein [Flavobacterium sp.]
MENKTYEVKIFYSGFCTYNISAQNEDEAILSARKIERNEKEILSNLENWNEADEATLIEDEKRSK